jgi:hypothetical protein
MDKVRLNGQSLRPELISQLCKLRGWKMEVVGCLLLNKRSTSCRSSISLCH